MALFSEHQIYTNPDAHPYLPLMIVARVNGVFSDLISTLAQLYDPKS